MDLTLDRWRELRTLDRAEVLERLGASEADVDQDVAYERIVDVDRAHGTADPAYVFMRGDDVVMIYVDGEALDGTTASELRSRLGAVEGERLRSRAGKTSVLEAYPSEGLAFSADGERLDFLEVFPPMSMQRYRDEVWEDPGPFIR